MAEPARTASTAVGLEPSTNHVTGEAAARENGELTWLEHGESREYRLTMRVLDGADAVGRIRCAASARSGRSL